MEPRPTAVPMAKQVGDVPGFRVWAEPTVWTERMLTALEQGGKGGVWFSLRRGEMASRLLCGAGVVQSEGSPCESRQSSLR